MSCDCTYSSVCTLQFHTFNEYSAYNLKWYSYNLLMYILKEYMHNFKSLISLHLKSSLGEQYSSNSLTRI